MTRRQYRDALKNFQLAQWLALVALIGQFLLQYFTTDDRNEKSIAGLVTALAILSIIGVHGSPLWKRFVAPAVKGIVLIFSVVFLALDLYFLYKLGDWDWSSLLWAVPLITLFVSYRERKLVENEPPFPCPHCKQRLTYRDGVAEPF